MLTIGILCLVAVPALLFLGVRGLRTANDLSMKRPE
jgi:hypothetical protein